MGIIGKLRHDLGDGGRRCVADDEGHQLKFPQDGLQKGQVNFEAMFGRVGVILKVYLG